MLAALSALRHSDYSVASALPWTRLHNNVQGIGGITTTIRLIPELDRPIPIS